MILRKATPSDIEAADSIYAEAKRYMKESGNPTQWRADYPSGKDVSLGIATGVSYVCEEDGEVVATLHFSVGDDPTYAEIYGGAWLDSAPYAVIHRIAVKYHGRGIADFCYRECFKLFPNLKIDTHRDNIPMQKSLMKNGFVKCGIIYLENGEERVAFQKNS